MPLTPEDVLNKHFTATQFRRGYDEQEVDDFLDEVVVELRRLGGENGELRRQVESGVATGPLSVASIAPGGADLEQVEAAEREAAERIEAANARAERAEQDAQARIEAAEREAAERIAAFEAEGARDEESPSAPAAAMAAPASSAPVQDAAGVIALAQKVHDEYVEQGRQEHDRLVDEAKARHEELVSSGQSRHDELVETGQSRHDELVSTGQARHDELVETGEKRHKELVDTAQARHDELIGTAEARHEELLRTGQAEHDRLVTTGQEEHDRLLSTARDTSGQLVGEAEQRREQILGELEQRRGLYDAKIRELSEYEGSYRSRLTSFIEEHLRGLGDAETVRPGDLPDAAVEQGAAAERVAEAVEAHARPADVDSDAPSGSDAEFMVHEAQEREQEPVHQG